MAVVLLLREVVDEAVGVRVVVEVVVLAWARGEVARRVRRDGRRMWERSIVATVDGGSLDE